VVHADIHVLGSVSGYTTLAGSSGVVDDERRELETLAFGDATGAEARLRLASHAVMTGRRLRSGRFAISRMLSGDSDDAGRPTVRVITLVLDERGYRSAVRGVRWMAGEVEFWTRAASSAESGIAIPDRSVPEGPPDRTLLRLFDLWLAARRGGSQAVLPESENPTLFRLLERLNPHDLAVCRWGIGLLSLSSPADILTYASGTNLVGARTLLRPLPTGDWHTDGMEYAEYLTERRGRLPSSEELTFGRSETAGPLDRHSGSGGSLPAFPPIRRWSIGSAVAGTAVLVVALVASLGKPGSGRQVFPQEGGGGAATSGPDPLATPDPSGTEHRDGSYGRKAHPTGGEPLAPGQSRRVPSGDVPSVAVSPPGEIVGSVPSMAAEVPNPPASSPPPTEPAGGAFELPGDPFEHAAAESPEVPSCDIGSFEGARDVARQAVGELKNLRGKPSQLQRPAIEHALCVLLESTVWLCRRLEDEVDRMDRLESAYRASVEAYQSANLGGLAGPLLEQLALHRSDTLATLKNGLRELEEEDGHESLRDSCVTIANDLSMGRPLESDPIEASRAGELLRRLNDLRRRLDPSVRKVELDTSKPLSEQVNAIWYQLAGLNKSRKRWLDGFGRSD
jgi:hypothetical protein